MRVDSVPAVALKDVAAQRTLARASPALALLATETPLLTFEIPRSAHRSLFLRRVDNFIRLVHRELGDVAMVPSSGL
jgi:hypothetical protein